MKISRRDFGLLGFVLALTALGALPMDVARAEGSGCSVTGRYTVVGHAPRDAAIYKGEAVISQAGDGCHVKWFPPNASQGTGDFSNGTLTIHFTFAGSGQTGLIRYQRAPNGDLHGVWWTNDKPDAWGTESLLAIR